VSILLPNGYTVHVVDIEQEPESIVGAALELNPILIGFSLIFQFYIDRSLRVGKGLRLCHVHLRCGSPELGADTIRRKTASSTIAFAWF
jgi:hypothetical protein